MQGLHPTVDLRGFPAAAAEPALVIGKRARFVSEADAGSRSKALACCAIR